MPGWMKVRRPLLMAVLGLAVGLSLSTASKEVQAASLVGRLVCLEGDVAVRAGGTDQWTAARLDQGLFAGDEVRTGSASRAAILCQDESQIKLNENTVLILKQMRPSTRQVPQGKIWLLHKNDKFRFELETPEAGSPIRG